MNFLVIGSGGREHALAWKLSQSKSVTKLFAFPGNPGIEEAATCLPGDTMDFGAIAAACLQHEIDLVVVGPESPLIAGITDFLQERGITVFGPSRECAQLEGSKAFSKRLMRKLGIPTAPFETFADATSALEYVRCELPKQGSLVIKASGEAFGKGVTVAGTVPEAEDAIRAMMVERVFGASGDEIVIESKLSGRELSLIAICNGPDYRLLPTAQDHKAAYDGDQGPNTGGMGAVSPIGWLSEQKIVALGDLFIAPLLAHYREAGTPYVGALFAGLMVTDADAFALEYNCRFGDPETQAAMLRMESDLGDLLASAATGAPMAVLETRREASAVVVIASSGYPGPYQVGIKIASISQPGITVFQAGTKRSGGSIESSGGRVLNVCALGAAIPEACIRVYDAIGAAFGSEWHYRKDIGVAQNLRPEANKR